MLDITAQKKAQIESENLEKQLIHAQKMEAIGTLAAGISHDFNNILSGIMGYTELALLQAPEGSALRERLEKIRDGSQRAANLVRQILAFSRREENKMGPVQLSSIIKEALKLLSSSLPPHISIVQDISSEPLSVNADPTQIHQLIMNLCTNAYHAMMESAAGTLEVTLRPEQVHDSGADKARTYLTLRIRDTGCGMTPEVQARIFEPYFTTKQKGLGTGLGLSIVHTVVKKHHGDLRVTSMPGCGSAFEIRFPAVEQGGGLKSQTRQALPTGSERILIVDDEKDVAAIWRQILTRQGYQVESRNDPIQALMDFRRAPDRYDLMVTDQAMPGMTGVMLAEELTRIRPGFPVILCTGYFEEMRNIPRCPSIREHLTKPVNLTTLAQTVRRVIDRAAQGHRIPPRISGPKSRLMAPYAEPPEA
jgi:nitrogen-specific signal transduction histidine kinase/ActR/RegA family two-component response regulator